MNTYQAPAEGGVAVKVDPNSQRLQLLEPFKPVGTKIEEAMVLLKVGCVVFRPACCHGFNAAKCLQALLGHPLPQLTVLPLGSDACSCMKARLMVSEDLSVPSVAGWLAKGM